MSFRQKLLLLFAATVFLCVAVISASVYSTMRGAFDRADQERANAVAAQFRSEFQRRGPFDLGAGRQLAAKPRSASRLKSTAEPPTAAAT